MVFWSVFVCLGWAVLQNPGSLELVKLSSLYFLESSCHGTHLSQTVLQETGVTGFCILMLDAGPE